MLRKFWRRPLHSPDVILLPAGEPGERRTVFRRMMQLPGLAALGGGGVLAVIVGISLGNGAISQIDPLYFQGAALHPRDRGAAVDPTRPTVIANTYAHLYGFAEGRNARSMECPGCSFARPGVAGLQMASAPYFGSREEYLQRQARERREIDQTYERRRDEAIERLASVNDDRIQRYTHYRVSEDEVVREPPEVPAQRPSVEQRERPYYARNDIVLSDDGDQK